MGLRPWQARQNRLKRSPICGPAAANVGEDKDSERRQRAAIGGYARAAGYEIVDLFYDAAARGADPVTARPGFSAMLDRIASNGVRTIIVESPDRLARDLAVQLAGHDYLKRLGVMLVPASAPDFFVEDTPTAVLVRQHWRHHGRYRRLPQGSLCRQRERQKRWLSNGTLPCG
ncbi:recombinase family protein [Bradyrhizobium cenepequi]|uniref:recombinase family protein n=1 Tax=Bradyrhizobium cenepequi TaxID=2821403 RepID=UPI001CE242EE|nr:recombinase family protein [Bradyrhizobium cenepequi]